MDGRRYISSTTCFFRDDFRWSEFGRYLRKRFEGENKIDTRVFACSDGSEAYSLSLLLHSMVPDTKRFLPVRAYDINQKMIAGNIRCQNSAVEVGRSEYNIVKSFCAESNTDKTPDDFIINYKKGNYYLTKDITRSVEFNHANILDEVNFLSSRSPSLIMCRNMWPYVDYREYEEFAKKLYAKLKKGSVVVLGFFDYKPIYLDKYEGMGIRFPDYLFDAGFEYERSTNTNLIHSDRLIYEKN